MVKLIFVGNEERRIARLLEKESKKKRSIQSEKGSQRFNNNKKLSSK